MAPLCPFSNVPAPPWLEDTRISTIFPAVSWRTNGKSFPKWAYAARIAFALSPNSASCERVFSALKLMFGDQQMAALGDYIRAALMLRINKREIG